MLLKYNEADGVDICYPYQYNSVDFDPRIPFRSKEDIDNIDDLLLMIRWSYDGVSIH